MSKKKRKKTMYLIEPKQANEKCILIANTMGPYMSHGGPQHMARAAQGVEN